MRIPFNRPFITGNEGAYIQDVIDNGHWSGNGRYTKRCQEWLTRTLGCGRAFLTHSGTDALEMAAILADIQPGDEVIMPSFTFVSTANAFVLRGGVPVFVDIRPDTLNLDETLVEAAITERTKAIVPVHYAGVSCEMDSIIMLAEKYRLWVIEDAAHGIMSRFKERPLGSIGHMAALSFHETKNLASGEGGALLVNDLRLAERAEMVWEKGTNRAEFFRGETDRYTWAELGSSFLPGEATAAFLWAQLEQAEMITNRRKKIWETYHDALARYERHGMVRRPIVPEDVSHNGHMYYLLLPDIESRTRFMEGLRRKEIQSVFHYVPLHNSPAGLSYGRKHGEIRVTCDVSDRLVRMPLWIGMEPWMDEVIEEAGRLLNSL